MEGVMVMDGQRWTAKRKAEEEIQRITLKPGASIVIEPLVKTEVVAEAQKGCTLTRTKVLNNMGVEEEVIGLLNPNGILVYYVRPMYNEEVHFSEALKRLKELKAAGGCGE